MSIIPYAIGIIGLATLAGVLIDMLNDRRGQQRDAEIRDTEIRWEDGE